MIYITLKSINEVFTDLCFADNMAIMSDMLEILILALKILHEKSQALGFEINWTKSVSEVTTLWHYTNVFIRRP